MVNQFKRVKELVLWCEDCHTELQPTKSTGNFFVYEGYPLGSPCKNCGGKIKIDTKINR